ncbi:oxidoreductase HTATIP2-like [Patiria miniata]|uniref:Protein HTATIP2 n=1 Tax=Patiria miniata TaxID=46514 RepID=A0A913ZND3_PATMI|nr:oxidoreductase HTATIP2-like [Patiria miniata]
MWVNRILFCFAAVFVVISLIIGYVAQLPIENEEIINSMACNVDEKMDAYRAKNQTAFVVGYTGEIGKEVVKELAKTKIFSNVFLVGRREVKFEDELFKDFKMEQKVVDFDKLDDSADVFKGHSVGICLMGTTRGKAGKEGFMKVDHDYIMKVGELAKAGGCQHYHLMSSTGANRNSSFLYPKVKGEVEEETRELGFERVSVYRPALLMCDRKESRPTEWLARKLMAPMEYLSPGTMTSPTTTVAKAIINTIISPLTEPFEIFESKAIHRITKPASDSKCKATAAADTQTTSGGDTQAAAADSPAPAADSPAPAADSPAPAADSPAPGAAES